ncbi:polyhydroxyalkanoate synthesis regulator phasin [Salibacterium salarium]|uniref:phasin family protein n=1 Tax=Salibacterium salarium TaxID=284579 RepID=UPI0027847BA0|nr:hypothetical protein [Salibacterium salarium]MDQ0299391.1 polyhydroxyalkanoate synthesis regulator phasin [Salibacterium salarium]
MNEMLKKGFFLGLGAASYGKEKVQQYVDDLVSKGKITPREAEQWKDELVKRGVDTQSEWTGQAKDKMQDSFKEMGLATEKDIERIEEKLHSLEQQLSTDNHNRTDDEKQ